jgi:hypothetical protein
MVGINNIENVAVWERLIHPVPRMVKEENYLALALCIMSKHYSVTRSLKKFGLISLAEYKKEKARDDDKQMFAHYAWMRTRRKGNAKR